MKHRELWTIAAACVLLPGMAFAQVQQAPGTGYAPPFPSMAVEKPALTPEQKQEGWQLLFDGQDFKGWHSYLQTGVGKDWSIVDGNIQLTKTNLDPRADSADLVTDAEYTNFDLKLEWRANPCIDSGVMFFVHESPEYRATFATGIEMQIADLVCADPDSRVLMERSGDMFDLISDKFEWVKPAGQWNQFEIIADHGHIQFFQNGHQVIDTQIWTPEWDQMVAHTKFARMPGFAKYHTGHISLQGGEPKGEPGVKMQFRNIMIKPL